MNKLKLSHKITILLLLLFCLLPQTNKLYAQGPNAPEAASFEPVDATDMVNLVTGDLSYVLPLLNVPSPEGGYPIALSYHAGIAMDQEASWVGLGWNINPGTINRGVNGYPDDWGKTSVNEFFYDELKEEDYYSFGVGATLGGGISVGLGASWGSNQSLGGFVSASIGLGGESGANIGASVGTNGASINGGIGGFSGSIGTNGVGMGYGGRTGESNSYLGVGLNYNYSSGLSGSVSVAERTSVGVSFSSNGMSVRVNGTGVSSSSYGISFGDYNIDVDEKGFFFPVYMFYVNFSHTKVKTSLFKLNSLNVSGILNPLFSNKTKINENGSFSNKLYENNFMDTNVIPRVSDEMDYHLLIDNNKQIGENNLVLPNYDNYSVTAQGLSGSIKPYSIEELNLTFRGKATENNDEMYAEYLDYDLSQYQSSQSEIAPNKNALNKMYFTFENAYNSFLRFEKTNIIDSNGGGAVNDQSILQNYNTTSTGNYNELSFLVNRRKKEGNYIKTYTNKEIRESYVGFSTITNIPGFIDAKERNNSRRDNTAYGEKNLNRVDTNIFLDDGIGAYNITTLDGRTYHYSLPVYQFESFYKNFSDKNNQDLKFFEIHKTTPYATHWLLTGITGPDYIDRNNNGTLDDGDYGYWVVFDYGRWSDGYVWQTPNGRFEEIKKGGGLDNTYSYAWGRKQIYYLDAIKTRTHTALFIKDLRDDNISTSKSIYNNNTGKWTPEQGAFNIGTFGLGITSSYNANKQFGKVGEMFYKEDGSEYVLPEVMVPSLFGPKPSKYYLAEKQTSYKYADIPKNKSLKLVKIILLNNKDFEFNFKNRGSLINEEVGYLSSNHLYYSSFTCFTNYDCSPANSLLYIEEPILKSFGIHQHKNVLDVSDINGLNLENNAQQIIEFNHGYSLAKNSINSENISKGRLTLDNVYFKGKSGIGIIPPYKFSYESTSTEFNQDKIDDWGYHNVLPQVWSLNSIQTPTGGKINIAYESDDYHQQAINSGIALMDGLMFNITAASSTSDIFLEVTNDFDVDTEPFGDFSKYFEVNKNVPLKLFICRKGKAGPLLARYRRQVTLDLDNVIAQVVEVTSDKVRLKISGNINYWYFDDDDEGWIVNRKWSKKDVYFASTDNPDGVIMRNTADDKCYKWRTTGYDNDDVSINYTLFTNKNLIDQRVGGIRVSGLTVTDGNTSLTTNYYYNTPGFDRIYNSSNYQSSGITSYAPSDDIIAIPYISELPPPSVMYGHVIMETKDANGSVMGSTSYEFQTLEVANSEPGYLYSLGDSFKVKEQQNETFNNGQVIVNKYTIYNKLGDLGRILSTTSYNSKGQILNKNTNTYKQNFNANGEIGVTQESHKSSKRVLKGANNDEYYYVSSTSKVNYPSVLKSTTVTQGGYTSTTYFDKYDFLTGQLLETRTYASDGTAFKTKTVPAYTIPEYSGSVGGYGMGSKVDDITNKNMLTQQAASYAYLLDEVNNTEKVIGTGISTWNNDWVYRDQSGIETTPTNDVEKIWRKHKNFFWKGNIDSDGTYVDFDDTTDDGFNWGVGFDILQTNDKWKQASEVKLYDHYSAPLETMDINNNFASTKMCDSDSKIMAVSNAKYTEMFYSGAEYVSSNSAYFDGEVKSIGQSSVKAHTGVQSIAISNGENGFEVNLNVGEHRDGKYKVSVWVDKGNEANARLIVGVDTYSFEDDGFERTIAGDWVLLNKIIDIPIETTMVAVTSASGTIYFDDFRLLPIASSITSYVYNEWDELWYIIGSNGLATMFEYDEAGRLIKTYTEVVDTNCSIGGFKKISENDYHYKGGAYSTMSPTSNYSIEERTDGNGTVSFSSNTIDEGDSVTVTITPNTGYEITSIKVNCISQPISNSFIISNVTSNTVVDVVFSPVIPTYSITETHTGLGTVSLSTSTVNEGGSVTVTITPNIGYETTSIRVNGVLQAISNSFTISNITSSQVVDVNFTIIPTATLTVTPTSLFFNWIDGTKTVTVNSSAPWTVTTSSSWLTLSTTNGTANGSFTVRPLKNLGRIRYGTIIVSNGSLSKTISITQVSDSLIAPQ